MTAALPADIVDEADCCVTLWQLELSTECDVMATTAI